MQDEAPAASGFRQCCRRHWRVAIPALLAAIALSAAFAIRLLRPQLVRQADRSDKFCWYMVDPTRSCTDCCKCQSPRTCLCCSQKPQLCCAPQPCRHTLLVASLAEQQSFGAKKRYVFFYKTFSKNLFQCICNSLF